MNLNSFSLNYGLADLKEIGKAELLAYFLSEVDGVVEFEPRVISSLIADMGFAQVNNSRLIQKIRLHKSFVKGKKKGTFKLSVKRLSELKNLYPDISESEEVISDSSILPDNLLKDTKRGYLIKLGQQINSAYENNLFDACSLMMRRMLEVLLIHCFEEAGIESQIKDSDGNYQNLKSIINKANSSAVLDLSNDAKKEIHEFRELGNLSAHRVKYNCRKNDIKPTRLKYRAIIEELLYASNLIQ